jgi:hypothetical protein
MRSSRKRNKIWDNARKLFQQKNPKFWENPRVQELNDEYWARELYPYHTEPRPTERVYTGPHRLALPGYPPSRPNFVTRGGLPFVIYPHTVPEERLIRIEDTPEFLPYDDFPGVSLPISDSEFWEEMDQERRERERALYEMDRRRQQQINWDGNEIFHRPRSIWD